MKLLLLTSAALALCAPAYSETVDTLAPRLQRVSVTVHAETGQGSGTIVSRGGENFALTAGHVVAGNREVIEVVDEDKKHPTVKFSPVTVVQEIYNIDGQSVGSTTVEADVIAFSSAKYGQDLALLHFRSPVTKESIEFSEQKILPVGTDLVHVGSLEGQQGSNSFTNGTLSQVGRVLHDRVYDQSSCPSFPGSSGGLIATKDGKYCGMLVRGSGETFNLFIPLRRIKEWAKFHHVEFLFDPKAKVELDKVRLSDKEPTEYNSRMDIITPDEARPNVYLNP